jgi:hypothetical protein
MSTENVTNVIFTGAEMIPLNKGLKRNLHHKHKERLVKDLSLWKVSLLCCIVPCCLVALHLARTWLTIDRGGGGGTGNCIYWTLTGLWLQGNITVSLIQALCSSLEQWYLTWVKRTPPKGTRRDFNVYGKTSYINQNETKEPLEPWTEAAVARSV